MDEFEKKEIEGKEKFRRNWRTMLKSVMTEQKCCDNDVKFAYSSQATNNCQFVFRMHFREDYRGHAS